MLESFIRKKFLRTLQHLQYGSITVQTPENETLVFRGQNLTYEADIQIYNWKIITNLLLRGDVGFAADYRDGLWSTNNLINLIKFGTENESILQKYGTSKFFHKWLMKLLYLTQYNTLKGSKKNIQAHYDLGNEFYQLWLDPSMTYSSAIFNFPHESLESAQQNKYKRILTKINKPCSSILEIGCGWGGFMKQAISQHHIIKGITLSKEQAKYSQAMLQNSNAKVAIEDYRDQSGVYDYIVSIEMLEAVGQNYWPIFFQKIKHLLKPQGKFILQTIVIADELFKQYAKGTDMIRTFIFPGGILPSEAILKREINKVGLVCKDIYHFGKDYALTLKHWLAKFERKSGELNQLGFNDNFIRLWKFYLAACSAEFTVGRINVVQIEICHENN